MRITLQQRHRFNKAKPTLQLDDSDTKIQWDECDLSESPPYRLKGSMTAHGKFPPYKYEELPTTFKDTDGNVHNVDDIISVT